MNKDIFWETDKVLHQAKKSIDELFGEGHANNHPELVSGFMVTASNNLIATNLSNIATSLSHIADLVSNESIKKQ